MSFNKDRFNTKSSNCSNHENNSARNQDTVDDCDVVEDTPMMMSVAMRPSPQSLISVPQSAPLMKSSPRIKQHAPVVEAVPAWNVTRALTIPPFGHRFERTHASVKDLSSAAIAERIVDHLAQASIAATYNSAEALAKAETKCSLKFAVRLWQKSEDAVVVELQRITGCSFLFQQTALALLRAAKFGGDAATRTTKAPSMSSPPTSFSCNLPSRPASEIATDTSHGLSLAFGVLCDSEERRDAHRLALESLVQLSLAPQCKALCAQTILLSPHHKTLCATLAKLVQKPSSADNSSSIDEDHSRMMHRLAVTVLAHCLEAVQESDGCADALEQHPDLTCASTLQSLVADLGGWQNQPHEAAVAAKCLSVLCEHEACARHVEQLGAVPAVTNGKGCRHHAMLQDECSKLLTHLSREA